ncbi:MAG: putative zinc-binding protein [Candidatus Thorarchaeota archaeon]
MRKVIVPCSGIGKVFGSVTREATSLLADGSHPDTFETICLPLLMTDDEDSKQMVLESDVYTIDGCPKKCASVLVKHVGGHPVKELLTTRVLAKNRDHKPETILDIGDGGRLLAEDIVRLIVDDMEK